MNSNRTYDSKLEYMNSIREHIQITLAWLSGFIDGEAYLGIHISSGSVRRCEPRFSISQIA